MDSIGDTLAPYSEFLGKFAGTITNLQFISMLALLKDIYTRKSADAYPAELFIGGFVLTTLGLKLGYVMNDEATINTNFIGIIINAFFFAFFYYYASADFRKTIGKKVGFAAAFLAACMAYAQFESRENLEIRFGMLITVILVYLIGSPLLHIGKIIEKKSTDGMPFPMILSGTVISASWVLYGLSIKNSVVIYQNILLFTLSAIQLSLFAIFPNKPVEKKRDDKKATKKTN